MLVAYPKQDGCKLSPKEAFFSGRYYRTKIKRHRKKKYDQYHYYLPVNIAPMLQFFKRYFYELDQFYDDLPPKKRYRQSEFEFPEMAIDALHLIRARIAINEPMITGSPMLSPVAWAVFGPNYDECWGREHFVNMQDVLRHYKSFIPARGFNPVNIARPLKTRPELDRLVVFAELFNESVNVILTCGLYLLFDLIRYCGPDCNEFHFLFSNNMNRRQISDIPTWYQARSRVIPDDKPDFGDLWLKEQRHNHSIRLSQRTKYFHYPARDWPGYCDVEITDAPAHVDLIEGEKVELFGEPKEKKKNKPPLQNIEDYTEKDLEEDEDDMVKELDREFRAIIGPPPPPNHTDTFAAKRKADEERESWSGLFEELYD